MEADSSSFQDCASVFFPSAICLICLPISVRRSWRSFRATLFSRVRGRSAESISFRPANSFKSVIACSENSLLIRPVFFPVPDSLRSDRVPSFALNRCVVASPVPGAAVPVFACSALHWTALGLVDFFRSASNIPSAEFAF